MVLQLHLHDKRHVEFDPAQHDAEIISTEHTLETWVCLKERFNRIVSYVAHHTCRGSLSIVRKKKYINIKGKKEKVENTLRLLFLKKGRAVKMKK